LGLRKDEKTQLSRGEVGGSTRIGAPDGKENMNRIPGYEFFEKRA
jgi:hypothetical protein